MGKGLSLAKIEYQMKVQQLLKDAWISSMGGNDTDQDDMRATKFALTCAPKLCDAVEKFIKEAHLVGTIPCNGIVNFAGVAPSTSLGSLVVAPNNLSIM